MGHSTACCSEMKMNRTINDDERNPEIAMLEKRRFYACVKIHPNLIRHPNCNGEKVFYLGTFVALFSVVIQTFIQI